MRIARYLGAHKAAVLLMIVLLLGQAFTDLSLPHFTSDIVDVGIQQSGVEHVAVDELSETSFRAAAMMLPEDEERLLRASYDEGPAGTYLLNDEGRAHIDALDRSLALPLIAVHAVGGASAKGPAAFSVEQVLSAYEGGLVSKDQVLSFVEQAREERGDVSDDMLMQQGIWAARLEYESLGYDLPAMQMGYLLRVGAQMLALAALGMALAVLGGFVASRTGAKIGYDLRSRLFKRVVSFSEVEINRFSAASLITRGTNDVQLIQGVSIMFMRMVLYAPILAVGGVIMVMATNASMGWIVVVAIVAVLALVAVLFKVAMPKFRAMQKLIDRVNLVARELLTGLPVVRAFDREDFEEQRFDVASAELMRTQLFTNRVMTFMMPLMMLIMNATSVAIVWVGGFSVDSGAIQTGDLIAFIIYAMVIIMSFLMIGMISIMLPRADVAAGRIDEVLACEPTICDPALPDGAERRSASGEASPAEGGRAASLARGARLVFENVSFRYDEGSECVLENVSFAVEPGQTLAIVGATGSGKSTIVKLVERFYDVTAGAILLDGVDVRDLPQAVLRKQLGYVPQKAFLFSGTVASNVAYGADDIDGEAVERALAVAQAKGFVDEKEEGAQAPIAQGGTNVSGGQRQRLAIARAVATRARLFLFDDSFSALDHKTDSALRRALDEQLGGSTRVIVAQRIATVMNADQIIVLDEGRVVGTGTHAELMETCGEYREIARSQLSEEELSRGGDAA